MIMYLLSLVYPYNIQVRRSIKMAPFHLSLTQIPSGPAIVVLKCANLGLEDDIASSMYARLEFIMPAAGLRQEADKNLKVA